MHTLYIASQSASRHQLLKQAQIPFIPIDHYADEKACSWEGSVHDIVLNIAHRKMEHVVLPEGVGNTVFMVTADTLSVNAYGEIHTKPDDYDDAVRMIVAAREGTTVSTGFCIRKMQYEDATWHIIDEHAGVVAADIWINIPEQWINDYFIKQPYAIEGYGLQFLERIVGSYTAVIGLPMFELRNALSDLGFYT